MLSAPWRRSQLFTLQPALPHHRTAEVKAAIAAGRRFIKSIQRRTAHGMGRGVLLHYGTWFGVEGLVLSGEPPDSPALHQACTFLLSKQNPNGGWGEDFTSCYDKAYAEHGMQRYGEGGSGSSTRRGLYLPSWPLRRRTGGCQAWYRLPHLSAAPNGDWKQEGIAGVFNARVASRTHSTVTSFPCGHLRVTHDITRSHRPLEY